jgi:hypothetical protein
MRYISDFIGAVEAERKKLSDGLTAGYVQDYNAYRNIVGQHQGLGRALEILKHLLEEDDDDERPTRGGFE